MNELTYNLNTCLVKMYGEHRYATSIIPWTLWRQLEACTYDVTDTCMDSLIVTIERL